MRYIADGKPSTRDEVAAAAEAVLRYPTLYPDLGIWHTTRRDTGAFIGWFSLNYAGKIDRHRDRLPAAARAWGQGFATEGATALAQYGFDDLGLHRIIGVTHPGNQASQRVLMKAGLADVRLGPLLRPPAAPLRGGTRRVR